MKEQTRLYGFRGNHFITLTAEAETYFEQKALKRKNVKAGMVIYYKVKGTNYPCRVTIREDDVFSIKENKFIGTGKLVADAELVPYEGY